ncbi:MAG: DMT family transporter [Chloroflexaceae bacterium]|jgi:drug/metabolite transporter (DMT)-like permease|nr:DMT family transporter [Chloroflexaceae bacterium]
MKSSPRTGYMLCLSAVLAWAATGPGLSYLLDYFQVPPLTLALWRDVIIALVCGTLLLLLKPGALRMERRDMRNFALIGVLGIGIYHAIFVYSVALNGAALAIVLIYLYPAFVTLGARIFFKEQIGLLHMAALLLALAGCVLVVRAYDPALLRSSWVGALVGVASAMTHASYVLFNQRAVARHSPWVSLTLTMFFGALTLVLLTTVITGPASLLAVATQPEVPAWQPWLVLAAIALGPTLGGYALFTMALRHMPGRTASLVVVLEVPAAALIAYLLLNERLEPLQLLGMLLVLCAAVLPSLEGTLAARRALPAEPLPGEQVVG